MHTRSIPICDLYTFCGHPICFPSCSSLSCSSFSSVLPLSHLPRFLCLRFPSASVVRVPSTKHDLSNFRDDSCLKKFSYTVYPRVGGYEPLHLAEPPYQLRSNGCPLKEFICLEPLLLSTRQPPCMTAHSATMQSLRTVEILYTLGHYL